MRLCSSADPCGRASSRIRAFGHLVERFSVLFVIHHSIVTSATFFERRLVFFEVGGMFPSDVAHDKR
jgi:hypothetical protein